MAIYRKRTPQGKTIRAALDGLKGRSPQEICAEYGISSTWSLIFKKNFRFTLAIHQKQQKVKELVNKEHISVHIALKVLALS